LQVFAVGCFFSRKNIILFYILGINIHFDHMVQKIILQENLFYQANVILSSKEGVEKKLSHGSNKEYLVLDSCRTNGKKQEQYKH
jgi:hypothetical protein